MARSWSLRILIGILVCSFLGTGFAGAYTYVHRYALYRGFPVPATPAGVPEGTIRQVNFHSGAIGAPSKYLVYLPPGYSAAAARGKRFPVLYLLHGYPGKMPVFINVGAVHVAANVLIHEHKIAPMILVMPAGKTGTLGADTEWADTSSGRWMSYLIDVVHDVDHRFSTYADRQHRGIAGDSLGGYAAMNVGLHHLGDFSVIQSWGGYFTQTPTGVFKGATAAALAENSPASYVASLRRTIHKLGLRTWLFQGRTDSADPALMTGFATQLHDAGADVHVGFFPGGHDWGLFRAQTPRMLVAAGRWFAQKPKSKARPPGFRSIGRALPTSVLQQITARRQARCLARKPTQHIRPSCRRYRAAHGIH